MVDIEANEVIKSLDELYSEEKLTQAIKKACMVVEAAAKRGCPADTGELRSSITSRVTKENGQIVGEIGSPLMYANYVEYGTGLFSSNGMGRKDVPWIYKDEKTDEFIATCGEKPQPFLNPALNDNRQIIMNIIEEAIKK